MTGPDPRKKSAPGAGCATSVVSAVAYSSTCVPGPAAVPRLHTVTCAVKLPDTPLGATMLVTTRSGPKPKPVSAPKASLLDSMSSTALFCASTRAARYAPPVSGGGNDCTATERHWPALSVPVDAPPSTASP